MVKKILKLSFGRIKLEEIFLLVSIFTFYLLRIPSLVEPYWYGDEGVYEVIGIALRHGRILYSQIWDNKPPILYLIYALFSGDQFAVRFASLVVGLLSLIVFYVIARRFFKRGLSIIFSTVFFALIFGSPLIEGNIANAENFMVLPILLAFYLLFSPDKKIRPLNITVAGVLLSFAFLTKIVALFDFAAFGTALIGIRFFDELPISVSKIKKETKSIVSLLKDETLYSVSFLIPILITAFYFLQKNALSDFFRATFSQNVGYVGYGNFFLFPMGMLVLKIVLLSISILGAFVFRKKLGRFGFIMFIWLFFSLFNAFFSARPYTHYLLVLLGSMSLLLGYIFENRKLSVFTTITLIAVMLLINFKFKVYTKIYGYYLNYASFVGDHKSVNDYLSFFDRKTPGEYDIARFIKLKTTSSEGIFIWGDEPQIYVLSGKLPPGRYTVSYHITFYKNAIKETQDALEKKSPKYIIQTKDSPEIGNFLDGYELRYKIDRAVIYERKS